MEITRQVSKKLKRESFEVEARAAGSGARAGRLVMARGVIETPVFMPVGTRGTVRTQHVEQLEEIGARVILANTYHLMVRPGAEVFERFGGLHGWMGWSGSILTDSGGFQAFSLPSKFDEDGVSVRGRHGHVVRLTPESSMAMQRAIGADIMMVLDQCIDATSARDQANEAMVRTHRWARRSLAARGDGAGAVFAIVQGACFEDLRRASAAALTNIDGFDGYAIGGLAVGETRAQRQDVTELTAALLPTDRPRYLMGVGTPLDLLEAVHRGVDMFDCVLPTALAQQGVAFTSRGRVELRRGVYKLAEEAVDACCSCEACTRYSRSYLHHLIKCGEPLGWQLVASHNLRFYLALMAAMRAHIRAGTFSGFHAEQRQLLDLDDPDNPPGPEPRRRPGKPTTRGDFALHSAADGFTSIRHQPSGEIMHSINDPDLEAERVYVGQSAHLARALTDARAELVVWDIGLGAAHNAMALIRAIEAAPTAPDVRLISFERDLDALRLALTRTDQFAHVRHAAPHRLAIEGTYRTDSLRWTLCTGDFRATFATQPPPDVVFYDPFSTRVDGPMWTLELFRRLFAHLDRPTEMFTYSSSTAVRSSLLAAGFHVARGVASGPKQETTIALTRPDAADFSRHALLGREWLERRARSSARYAPDVTEPAEMDRLIAAHPQFYCP